MRLARSGSLLASLVLLSACGGGGGSASSGGSSAVSVPPPPGPQLFQPQTTVTLNASSAVDQVDLIGGNSARGIAAADTVLSTVTVTTDANNRVSAITLNVATGGAGFSHSFAMVAPLSQPVMLADLSAAGLGVVNGNAPTASAVFSGAADGLSFSTFGTWIEKDTPAAFQMGAAAAGFETSSGAVPHVGSATYTGSTIGFGNINHQPFALAGNAQLTADFGSQLMAATFSNVAAQNLAVPGSSLLPTVPSGTLPTLTGTASILGNRYSGGLTGGPLSGTFTGTFYGANAEETAGVWQVTGPVFSSAGSVLTASFGAKR